MNLEEIKELMQEFDSSSIQKFSLQTDTFQLKLDKRAAVATVASVVPAMQPAQTELAPVPVATEAPVPQEPAYQGTPVRSPVVGTFYEASAPGAKPYVTVGQHVEQGQSLCIVEAMKMMNEIKAPVSGTITEILVKQEEMVEFDQIIMLIQE